MAVVTVSIRARSTIAVLRVRDDVIVMQTMLWHDEIRSPEFAGLGEDTDAKPSELAMANLLVESLAGDYVPGDYEDDYKQAVDALVTAKLEGGEGQAPPAARGGSGGGGVGRRAALRRRGGRTSAAPGGPGPAGGPAWRNRGEEAGPQRVSRSPTDSRFLLGVQRPAAFAVEPHVVLD